MMPTRSSRRIREQVTATSPKAIRLRGAIWFIAFAPFY
jgi:hypothetical protein